MILLAIWLAASQPTPAVDCETVRAKVAQYGKARALAWALENGYSWRQINLARKCLVTR